MAAYKLTDGDKAVVEALAGVFGTLTATCFMFPMDTARARVQVSFSLALFMCLIAADLTLNGPAPGFPPD